MLFDASDLNRAWQPEECVFCKLDRVTQLRWRENIAPSSPKGLELRSRTNKRVFRCKSPAAPRAALSVRSCAVIESIRQNLRDNKDESF